MTAGKILLATGIGMLLISAAVCILSARIGAVSVPLDSAEAQGFIDTLDKANLLFYQALRNGGDVSQFDKVLSDSWLYPASWETQKFVRRVLRTDAPLIAGYLSAMKAKYLANGRGMQVFQEISAQAESEERELTRAEMEGILAANYGSMPPSVAEPGDTYVEPEPTYNSLKVKGNFAFLEYDSGPALQEAIFWRNDSRWTIIWIRTINAHW